MTAKSNQHATFVAKETYRKRRMRDLARAVPVIGLVLLGIPLMWGDDTLNSFAIIYVFLVWLVLIGLAAAISRAVSPDAPKGP
jgi:hypothetical protein